MRHSNPYNRRHPSWNKWRLIFWLFMAFLLLCGALIYFHPAENWKTADRSSSGLAPLPSEEPARQNARRSLVAARSIAKGAVIAPEDLTWKRPAHGISPRNYDEVLGMRAAADIAEDTVLTWALLV